MAANGIETEYKEGKMILTHPSGFVSIYTEKDVDNWIERLTNRIVELNVQAFDMKLAKEDIIISRV